MAISRSQLASGSRVSAVQRSDQASVLKNFFDRMAYKTPDIWGTNEELEAAMRAEMYTRGIRCPQLERTLNLAASLIELAYNECTFEEKKAVALYNWYLIYVDDMASRQPGPFVAFQQRFLRGQPQQDPVLDALVDVLLSLWDHYETECANSILAATFEFVTYSCIEQKVEALPLVPGAVRFPWFLRDRTGVAVAFAHMIFPKSRRVHLMEFVQAMPDFDFWISITNDLLSFYKEEVAGETTNYVHNRANIEGKSPLQVFSEMEHELCASRNTLIAALAPSPNALRAWRVFERGYVAWHLAQDRYKLKDLGL